jgi:hypothetical protein
MLDPVEFGKSMGALVRDAVAPLAKQNQDLEARIKELEARQLQKGDKGEPGKDAVAPTKEDIAVALLPLLDETIADRIAKSMPAPMKGDKGDDGQPGKDAEPIDLSDVAREIAVCPEIKTVVDLLVAESVTAYMAAHPVKDGATGLKGDPGPPGAPGEKGMDGVGQAGAMIDRDGCLIITTTKGEAIKLGKVVGENGQPGRDGQDFSDVTLDYDGERTLTIKNRTGGEIVKRMPIPMDKGYWRDGMSCEKGDIVTEQGNAWIARRDNTVKPCLENRDDWRLLARKGKDGNDGKPGRDLGPPPPVKLGTSNA